MAPNPKLNPSLRASKSQAYINENTVEKTSRKPVPSCVQIMGCTV